MRFSSEADSLNFSVLGVDVAPGTAEFDLYVRQLVTEMTSKAGQKCTAIRRALVPERAGARGHRRGPGPDRGQGAGRRSDRGRVSPWAPLVGLAQRDDVRRISHELAPRRRCR